VRSFACFWEVGMAGLYRDGHLVAAYVNVAVTAKLYASATLAVLR
jgi:hypothetical protein